MVTLIHFIRAVTLIPSVPKPLRYLLQAQQFMAVYYYQQFGIETSYFSSWLELKELIFL